jgi:putative endonuclease
MTTSEIGRRGEGAAVGYLEARGMRVLDRNYRFGREEIDIVAFEPTPANDGGMIVFVEVKARSGTGFGRPEAAVDQASRRPSCASRRRICTSAA